MIVSTILAGTLPALSVGLNLWQWFAARAFPLHTPQATDFTPPVSILKPLRGMDSETEGCLRSWLTQDYPGQRQILFGVANSSDPVCALVDKLLAEFPKLDAKLIICPQLLGPNGKVSTLIQLEEQSIHDLCVVSDADVWVNPLFLRNIVAPLSESKVGAVNCFYMLSNPRTVGMHWEAIAVNADFWSQVLQSRTLKPMDFALGAVMATRRENLRAIGGFASLVNFLADEYQLGNRLAKLGLEIDLSHSVVECRSGVMTFIEAWKHQLRWSRTIRVCQPVPYFLSILSNPTLWPALWVILQPGKMSGSLLAIALMLRILTAGSNEMRLTRSSWPFHAVAAPLKDLLQAAIWALAFLGNKVTWRGITYRVDPGGALHQIK